MKDIFLLVDGNSLMHRAFHALPVMDADGIYTNAVYGFLSMLLKVIKEENVQYLAVCFDEHGPTFRHTVYADYKAGRKETPPELRQQFGTILSLLDDMGIRRFSLQGWEADDLLGTLSLKGAAAGATPLLLTGDRDALQLVGGGTELMFTRKGISETIRFTPSKVYEEYGFTPEQVTDWKGLAGDSSDNIPGVPGVGDKTAVKLLQEYGTLEKVLENADKVKGKLGEKLAAYADQARFSKELATIRRDAPVEFTLSSCVLPDLRKGIPALAKLKLNSIIKRLDSEGEGGETEEKKGPEALTFEPAVSLESVSGITAWLEETKTLEKFRTITKPFVMRRLKTDDNIKDELPDKIVNDIYCSLTNKQIKLYNAIMDGIFEDLEGKTGIERRGIILNIITGLKQACNHPAQFLRSDNPKISESGKMELLITILENILDMDEKVIIFTQYAQMGKIIQKLVSKKMKTGIKSWLTRRYS